MRGHLRKRARASWTLVIDIDPAIDPETGIEKRRQKWITVKGTRKQAEARLNDELAKVANGEFVDATKMRFGDWLDDWFNAAVEGKKAPHTVARYSGLIDQHIKPDLGRVRLQAVTATTLEKWYAQKRSEEKALSEASLALAHNVIHSALASAERKKLVRRNEAKLVDGKPRPSRNQDSEVRANCWEAEEARTFLRAATDFGPQQAAFYALALELGLRKNEIAGLLWEHTDLDAGSVRLVRQLHRHAGGFSFAKLKSGKPRTLDLSPRLVEALKVHRSHQAELKLRNRAVYRDHDLVFAKEWKDISHGRAKLGEPLQTNNIGQREFDPLIKAAGVRRIKFHGIRHTAATLALRAGVPVKVVSERLGHARTSITLDLYSHALPSMQKDAAARIGSLLHG